jgi:hypothetical protein
MMHFSQINRQTPKRSAKLMNPVLTPYELLAMLGLVTYLCAPALRKLFDPEIQRARMRVTGRRATSANAASQNIQSETVLEDSQEEAPRASTHTTPRPEELRVALTRSCADALLAALQGGLEGAPKTAGTIDSKLAEALRPGCRTIKIEVDDSSLPEERESGEESNANGQRMFVVRSAAAGEVRVSSPWEYMSEPNGGPSKRAPATIWSAHSNFLGLRPSILTPISPPTAHATAAGEQWTPKPSARRA